MPLRYRKNFDNDIATTAVSVNDLGGGPEPDLVHFDRATLLMRAGNNQNLYEELLAMAKDQFEEYLAALETALQAGDDEAIRRSAHTLRGAAMTMCFNRLADEVRNFEQRHALGVGTATAVFFGPIRGEWQALLGLLYQ